MLSYIFAIDVVDIFEINVVVVLNIFRLLTVVFVAFLFANLVVGVQRNLSPSFGPKIKCPVRPKILKGIITVLSCLLFKMP